MKGNSRTTHAGTKVAIGVGLAIGWCACFSRAPVASDPVVRPADSSSGVDAVNALADAEKLAEKAVRLREAGDYEGAASATERALALRQASLAPDHPLVVTSLLALAWCRAKQYDYSRSQVLASRALALLQAKGRPRDPQIAEAAHLLALEALNRRDFVAAKRLFWWAEELLQDRPESAAYAELLNDLAIAYLGDGDPSRAERVFRHALAVAGRVESAPLLLSDIQGGIAESLRHQRKDSEAEPFYLESLRIRAARFPPDHPSLAAPLNNLAAFYHYRKHDLPRAEPLYRRALGIYAAKLSPDHIRTAQVRINLGLLLCEAGEWDAGERLFRQGIDRFEAVMGPEHRDVNDTRAYFEKLMRARDNPIPKVP
ncbi:MAG: tetratricopeptide repeat protein [Deltaproteobacteria bacterium]|nr:tetratricopeptide repeat protein [Deltaproteobacteria bacterium]